MRSRVDADGNAALVVPNNGITDFDSNVSGLETGGGTIDLDRSGSEGIENAFWPAWGEGADPGGGGAGVWGDQGENQAD